MPRGPRGPIEKPKDRKKVLLRLWTYIYAHKWMALGAVLLTVASNLLALLGPMLSGAAIDAIGIEPGQADFPTVFFYCGLMIVFYAVSSLLSYILSILMIQLSQKIVFQMRQQVFDRLTQLPVRYFDGHQTGDIVSRISYDIDTVNASLSNDLLQIAASVITVVGSFIMMVAISPVLVLVFVITIPMSILFTRYMTKKVRPLFHQRSVKLGEMNGFVEEIITGQKTTKAYHQEETMVSRFDERNKAAVDAYYNADYYGGMTGPSVNFINNLSLAFVSIFGAILFLWGHLSIGNLSSFVLYSRRFSGPINEVANIISELQSACAAAERLIPSTLELGGKSANIFFEDCDWDRALDGLQLGILFNQGQVCCAGSRGFVQESIYDKFVEAAVKAFNQVNVGDPLDPNTQMGSQVDQGQLKKIMSYVELAKEEGATIACGGEPCKEGACANGAFMKPTLIVNANNSMRVAQEEIFGPVAVVIKFKTEEEVIAMANDSVYGLGGAVWTQDINRAFRVARAIETGRMWVNTYNMIPAGAPFGGYKQSGIGRETHKVILEHYTQQKNIMINLNETPSGFYPAK